MGACNRHWRVGPSEGGRGAAAPRVRSHPGGLAARPPSSSQFLSGPGPCPRWYYAQVNSIGGLFPFLLFTHFSFTLSVCVFCLILFNFHLHLNMCPAKHVFSNKNGTRSIVHAYVSKVCLFLLFWIIIGGRMLSLVNANKSPKLNLCSSRANT